MISGSAAYALPLALVDITLLALPKKMAQYAP